MVQHVFKKQHQSQYGKSKTYLIEMRFERNTYNHLNNYKS